MAQRETGPAGIDVTVAHPARMYDYFLGGKDHFEADRIVAEKVLAILPDARVMARANRAFLGRAVRTLLDAGVRQFLDIGTGIPGPGSTCEIAHGVDPDASVVCVDNDALVLAHSRALLAGPHPSKTVVVEGDIREPETILQHADIRSALDFSQPIAVLLVAVLHFIRQSERPERAVAILRQALCPGSYLVISHGSQDFDPEVARQAVHGYDEAAAPFISRSHGEVQAYFDGLDMLEPGLVQLPWWRPDGPLPPNSDRIWIYGGVGRVS